MQRFGMDMLPCRDHRGWTGHTKRDAAQCMVGLEEISQAISPAVRWPGGYGQFCDAIVRWHGF